jgi:hypothetical protein
MSEITHYTEAVQRLTAHDVKRRALGLDGED